MRRFLSLSALGFFLTVAIGAYIASRYFAMRSPEAGRHLAVPRRPLSMGFIAPDSRATINFPVSNCGTEPVAIKKVLANCGCTVARINAKVLNPGEAATIHVTFRSRGFWRGVEKKIFIISDDDSKPVRTVTLLGYVRIGTKLDANTISLGSGVFGAKLRSRAIHIFADAGVTEGTPHLVGGDHRLVMLPDKWKSVDAGQAQRCTLWVTEKPLTQLPGTYSRKVFVVVGGAARLPLRVIYTIQPIVTCTPAEVTLGKPGQGAARASLRYKGHPVRIDSISSASGYCRAKVLSAGTGRADLRISRGPSGRELKVSAIDVLRVKYDLDGGARRETLPIPVLLER